MELAQILLNGNRHTGIDNLPEDLGNGGLVVAVDRRFMLPGMAPSPSPTSRRSSPLFADIENVQIPENIQVPGSIKRSP